MRSDRPAGAAVDNQADLHAEVLLEQLRVETQISNHGAQQWRHVPLRGKADRKAPPYFK